MAAEFVPVSFEEVAGEVRGHLAALPTAIDSYLEDHILASRHYRIIVGGEAAGFAAIHGESLITQFALVARYRQRGQPLYARLRHLEQVQAALVPTADQFYLAHALDDYRQLAKQAYFFAAGPAPVIAPGQWSLRPATIDDVAFIRQESGDFFSPIEGHITLGELYVTLRDGTPVGFGLTDISTLYPDVASIGMYTIERFRQQGVGAATLGLLRGECQRRGLRAVAGCWYYNHRSKRTLERGGMHSPTRLLKISY
ncbi:MAG TPA: GNAT family N-acetyltransferase [Thermomicrobiales bacterium]